MRRRRWRKRINEGELLDRKLLETQSFKNKIVGQKVILVIPSASLLLNENGEKIDNNFDTVIRVGHGYETDGLEEWVGTKTDAVYHGLKNSPKKLSPLLLESYGIKDLCYICNWSIQQRGQALERMCDRKGYPINILPRPSWKSSMKNFNEKYSENLKENFRPLYGVSTFADLLSLNPKELMLYGADFYQAGHQPNYDHRDRKFQFKKMKRMAHKYHNLPRNKAYTAKLVIKSGNAFIDEITFNSLIQHKTIKENFKKELEKKVKEL